MGMLSGRKSGVYAQRGHAARHDAGVIEHIFVQKSIADQVPEVSRRLNRYVFQPTGPEEAQKSRCVGPLRPLRYDLVLLPVPLSGWWVR